MPDEFQIEAGTTRKTRGKKLLAVFVSSVIASAAGRLVMALFQVLSVFSFAQKRAALQEGLSIAGPVFGIAAARVITVLVYGES